MVPISYYIILSAILFSIGALGVLIRKNALIIFMSVELMLNAANLAMVAFGSILKTPNGEPVFTGQIFVFSGMSMFYLSLSLPCREGGYDDLLGMPLALTPR